MKPHCVALTVALLLASTAALADEAPAPVTPAPVTPAPFTPATGLTVEGRLRLTTDGASVVSGPSAPFLVGWRGERLALLVGPTFGYSSSSDYVNIGLNPRAELTVGRFDERRIEAYVPLEGTIGGSFEGDTKGFWSVGVGFGARYWVTQAFGVFAEGGVGVRNRAGDFYSVSDPGIVTSTEARTTSASVTSSLGLAYTF